MVYLKYKWLIGVFIGCWIIKKAWYDPVEGPYIQFFGLCIAIVSIVLMMEAYRKSIVEEIYCKLKENKSEAS